MLVAALAGCGPGAAPPSIAVFAAASLKPAFTEIAERFETDNPGAVVEFNFGGSPELVRQLTQGAGADVFASAGTPQMDTLGEAGLLAGKPVPFATVKSPAAAGELDTYAIAVLKNAAQPGLAQRFVDLVTGERGQKILHKAGFASYR
jgi:molybdate transport system substrate-binding protein